MLALRLSRRRLSEFVLAGAVVVLAATAAAETRKPVTHTVTIDASRFQPAKLTVRVGDSVVWVNKDLFPHTATSKPAGTFDSKVIAAGKSWTYTATKKGALDYVCIFHPTMAGTLTVK